MNDARTPDVRLAGGATVVGDTRLQDPEADRLRPNLEDELLRLILAGAVSAHVEERIQRKLDGLLWSLSEKLIASVR